jgi:hypothetical protein
MGITVLKNIIKKIRRAFQKVRSASEEGKAVHSPQNAWLAADARLWHVRHTPFTLTQSAKGLASM